MGGAVGYMEKRFKKTMNAKTAVTIKKTKIRKYFI